MDAASRNCCQKETHSRLAGWHIARKVRDMAAAVRLFYFRDGEGEIFPTLFLNEKGGRDEILRQTKQVS